MRQGKKWISLTCAILLFSGCAAVTITPHGQNKATAEPDYNKKQPLFLFGLVGEPHVDVKAICGERKVRQLQTKDEFSDRMIAIITLAIYTPRTAKVWCEPESNGAKT